jgi:hypothetical protein
MKQIEREEVGMALVTSFEAIGREDGRAEGRTEGQQELVLRLLTRKLGPLPAEVPARIAALESATMLLLADALLDFATQEDLRAWLGLVSSFTFRPTSGAPPRYGRTDSSRRPAHTRIVVAA